MYVPSYQMHNVLNVYSRQLRQSIASDKKKIALKNPLTDQIHLTPEGKRRATLEKVSKDILDKITRFESPAENHHQITERINSEINDNAVAGKESAGQFVFNVIDHINTKRTNTLSVEDSRFLIQQLEQLAKEAANKTTQS